MDAFLGQLRSSPPQQWNKLLSVDLAHASQQIATIQNSLTSVSQHQIEQSVENAHLNDDWTSLNPLVVSFLVFCKNVDPWSILQSHDLLLSFLNQLSIAFMNGQYGEQLCPLMAETVSYILPIMRRVDLVLDSVPGKNHKRLVFISTVLSKVFNHLRALKGSPKKRQLIIFIVNNLNKVYFIIGSPLLCANIFANVNLLELKFKKYPRAQQCEYRYILGRFYMIKNELYKAHYHLSWVFRNILRGQNRNLIRVLRYLLPVSLLIGKVPSKQVLSQFPELYAMYSPLVIHMSNGNEFEFQRHLFMNQHYFKSKSLLILLAQRSRILLYRNLFYKVFQGVDINRLRYDQLQIALMVSLRSSEVQRNVFGDQYLYQTLNEDVDYAFVQNVCSSLIENDMIKGNVMASAKLVVLSKANPFPDVYGNVASKFGISGSEKWMDK